MRGRVIRIVSFALAAAAAVLLLQTYVFREYWQYGQGSLRVRGFYREPADSLDVVFIGDSTVYAGYAPGLAYELEGYTSYACAVGSNVVTTWKTITEDVLRTQSPRLIVVEVGGAEYDDLQTQYDTTSTLHTLFDNMPWSAVKMRAIGGFLTREAGQDAVEFILPFVRWHLEWSGFAELGEKAREMLYWQCVSRNALKGLCTRVESEIVSPDRLLDVTDDRTSRPLTAESEAALRDYLAYCAENNLNVLFISAPCRVRAGEESWDKYTRCNRAGEIVEACGFPFVSFYRLTDEIGLDMTRDFFNDGHLNYRGQIKFTTYISRLLTDEYGVVPRPLTEAQTADWERTADYTRRLYAYAADLELTGGADILTERRDVMRALEGYA